MAHRSEHFFARLGDYASISIYFFRKSKYKVRYRSDTVSGKAVDSVIIYVKRMAAVYGAASLFMYTLETELYPEKGFL